MSECLLPCFHTRMPLYAAGLLGASGLVYTWGGMAGTRVKDHHRGCLGLGDLAGRSVPTRCAPVDDVGVVQCVSKSTCCCTVGCTQRTHVCHRYLPSVSASQVGISASVSASPWVCGHRVVGPLQQLQAVQVVAGATFTAVVTSTHKVGRNLPAGVMVHLSQPCDYHYCCCCCVVG